MSVWDGHPLQVLLSVIRTKGVECSFEFARYRYQPQTLQDPRDVFKVASGVISDGWLSAAIGSLQADQELALHSRVSLPDGSHMHIPMVDFSGLDLEFSGTPFGSLLEEFEIQRFDVFASGRSFHGYGLTLIPEAQWMKFMSSLLLVNMPGRDHIIDCRWIGHRLRAGYASLRWSCNSSSYTQLPKFANSMKI